MTAQIVVLKKKETKVSTESRYAYGINCRCVSRSELGLCIFHVTDCSVLF